MNINSIKPLAPVAQWIEQHPSKVKVVGSIPTWGTIKKP